MGLQCHGVVLAPPVHRRFVGGKRARAFEVACAAGMVPVSRLSTCTAALYKRQRTRKPCLQLGFRVAARHVHIPKLGLSALHLGLRVREPRVRVRGLLKGSD